MQERLFHGQWREGITSKLHALTHGIDAVDTGAAIICQTCGIAFGSRKAMLIHAAKAHSNQPAKQKFHREEHSTQGLPICRLCATKFTRWAGLRDHVEKQRCAMMQYTGEVKPSKLLEAMATTTASCSGQCQQSSMQKSARTTQDGHDDTNAGEIIAPAMLTAQATVPSMPSSALLYRVVTECPGFKINEIYRADPELRNRLKQECGICGQWVASAKSMKIHYRHRHNMFWDAHATQAQAFCRAFAALGNPCYMCVSTSKDRKHIL